MWRAFLVVLNSSRKITKAELWTPESFSLQDWIWCWRYINGALIWFLYHGCYSFLLNRILAPEDLALKTLHAFQTSSLTSFNVSVLQASQEKPVLLVSMLVRSSTEVDEDRCIHLGVVLVVNKFEEGIRWLESLSRLEVFRVNGNPQSTPSSLLASSSQV